MTKQQFNQNIRHPKSASKIPSTAFKFPKEPTYHIYFMRRLSARFYAFSAFFRIPSSYIIQSCASSSLLVDKYGTINFVVKKQNATPGITSKINHKQLENDENTKVKQHTQRISWQYVTIPYFFDKSTPLSTSSKLALYVGSKTHCQCCQQSVYYISSKRSQKEHEIINP
eukprot:TRINITY_DN2892_c0_g1_i2.p1 TRINITY_DN2892_c0_g1~~TRINITY_DN2892_c0_g1_i2.p1  ORF type:complete len:170 (-),score=4.97 TRINITY_DN2892_c0_g1_i2:209-718(-)